MKIQKRKPENTLDLGSKEKSSDLRAFIDTNIFLYAIELHPEFGKKSEEILRMVDEGVVFGIISSLVLMEMCWYLESRGKLDELMEAVEVVERSRIEVIEVTGDDVSKATEWKTMYSGVDLNDLVNYCIMNRLNLRDIFTNDSHFQQLPDITPHFT
ncbi:MAG: type II toxin-antitoxin system VapC family toxin [Candidatus Bathyarchaeia archaeon]